MDVENFYAKSRMPKKDQQRLVTALRRKMRTQREIADKLGLDYNVLRTAYKHLGINSVEILRERERQEEEPWVDAVKELAGQGKSVRQIAEILSVPNSFVMRIFKKYKAEKVRQPRHGTATEYNHFGCRCVACISYNSERSRRNKEDRLLRPEDTPHGTTTGYWNWNCRCDECCLVGSRVNRERTQTPVETQTRVGERWADSEVDNLRSYAKIAREHAIELGRTTTAVNTRRALAGIRKEEDGQGN